VFAAGLHPASSATVVRSSGDQVSMTDGPYAETKEQMGGFWIIEAADLDAASTWPESRRCQRRSGRSPSDAGMTDTLDAVFRAKPAAAPPR
jgi:hypothetical protein